MPRTRRTPRLMNPAALGVLVLTALTCAFPAVAQAVPVAPQLSIAVDDGRPAAGPLDQLTYRITVTNLGAKPVQDLIVTQSIPDGAELQSTDPEATIKAQTVSWSVDLKTGKTATRQTTITLAETLPDGLLRLATVTCARTTAKAPPLVCASDSDQLPAGAVADQQRRDLEQPAADGASWWPLPGAIVVGGLVLALLITALLLLRRRSRHPGGPSSGADDHARLVSSSRL